MTFCERSHHLSSVFFISFYLHFKHFKNCRNNTLNIQYVQYQYHEKKNNCGMNTHKFKIHIAVK